MTRVPLMADANLSFPNVAEIYSSSNLRVRYGAGFGSSSIAITFTPWRTLQSLDHEGFAEPFLAGLGMDSIFVTCATNQWYQYEDVPAALRAIQAVAQKYSRRVTYGSSMGAFAALAFSAAVQADLILAISPQFSLDPSVASFETRWRPLASNIRWLYPMEAMISRSAECVVIYDNRHLDRMHVDLLSRVRPVTSLALPFSGHPSGEFLKEVGLVSRITVDLLQGSRSVPIIRQQVRRVRQQSSTYWHEMAGAWTKRKRFDKALAAVARAIELAPRRAKYFHTQGGLAVRTADFRLAVESFREVARLLPARADALFNLAKALERAGEHDLALKEVENALALERDDARLAAYRDQLLQSVGRGVT